MGRRSCKPLPALEVRKLALPYHLQNYQHRRTLIKLPPYQTPVVLNIQKEQRPHRSLPSRTLQDNPPIFQKPISQLPPVLLMLRRDPTYSHPTYTRHRCERAHRHRDRQLHHSLFHGRVHEDRGSSRRSRAVPHQQNRWTLTLTLTF